MAVALLVLLVVAVGGGALLLAAANGGKQEATAQVSLDDLIPHQVGDFTLQTSEPLKAQPEHSTDTRQTTYRSSDGTEVNHVVGFVTTRYAYSEKSANSEAYVDGFLKLPKGMDLGGEPERSEFQVEDEYGKQIGRGVLLQGTQYDWLAWVNGRLNAVVRAPTGEGQDFYNELPY
jgi:hypothetical protein